MASPQQIHLNCVLHTENSGHRASVADIFCHCFVENTGNESGFEVTTTVTEVLTGTG